MRWGLVALAAALAATLAVFALWPQIDIEVSRYFYGQDGFIGQSAAARLGRNFFRVFPFVVLAVFAALYLVRRLGLQVAYAPSGRALLFLVATMAIGPGLIVNLGFKDHAHRPRPVNVTEFGGPDAFRPWYRFDGACGKNCSFPSGEGSQGFWMVAPALLAPPPLRMPAIGAALAFGAGASVLRMAFGGHFLSDVIVAALISLIVIAAAYRLIWPRGGP